MNVKSTFTLTALALAAATLVAGCNNDGTTTDDTAAVATTGADADPMTDPTLPADGDVTPDGMNPDMNGDAVGTGEPGETLALVMAVDQHEVAAAEQARDKDLPEDVAAYAVMLHEAHSKNLEADRQVEQDSGITAMTTEAVTDHKNKGEAELERLGALDGEAYADAYVDAMVKGHTEALAMIDERMATTTDAALKAHLAATREAVAAHLERGKELQAE